MKKKCPNCLCMVDMKAKICSFCKTAFKEDKVKNSSLNFRPPTISNQEVSSPIITKIEVTANITPPQKIVFETEIEKELKQEVSIFTELEKSANNKNIDVKNEKDPFAKPEKEKKMLERIYEKVIDKAKGKNYLFDTINVDTRLDALGFVEDDLNFKQLKKLLPKNIISDQNTIEIKPIESKEETKNFQHHVFALDFLEVPDDQLSDIDKNLLESIKSGNVFINDEFDVEPDFDLGIDIDSKVHSYNDLFVQESTNEQNTIVSKDNQINQYLKDVAKKISNRLNSEHPFEHEPFELGDFEIAEIEDLETLEDDLSETSLVGTEQNEEHQDLIQDEEVTIIEEDQSTVIVDEILEESNDELKPIDNVVLEETILEEQQIDVQNIVEVIEIYKSNNILEDDLLEEINVEIDNSENVNQLNQYFDQEDNINNISDYEQMLKDNTSDSLEQKNSMIFESVSLSSIINQQENIIKVASENENPEINSNLEPENNSNDKSIDIQSNINSRLRKYSKNTENDDHQPLFNMDDLTTLEEDNKKNIIEQIIPQIEPINDVVEVKEILNQRLKRFAPKEINPDSELQNSPELETVNDKIIEEKIVPVSEPIIKKEEITEQEQVKESEKETSLEVIKRPIPNIPTNNVTTGARSTTNSIAMNHYIQARDLCVKRDYQKALLELEESVKIDPAFEQAHILLSRTYLKIKNTY